ncbi:MAG TPA: hypothetical protein VFD73_04655 [Gemmatimonadales bacterium]|nr:hypothetical protein [Gemmatimonadales bacterium]
MPRRLLYGLPDALRAARYTNLPEPADIARTINAGLIPWIERRDGRWSFDEGDIDRIAGALGLTKPAPEPNLAPHGIAEISAKIDELLR